MMGKCFICQAPTDMTLSDAVTQDVRDAHPFLPLVGSCGKDECIRRTLTRLDLSEPKTLGPRVEVVGGRHDGLVGTLYSSNDKGVSFIRPEPADGTLKAVRTSDVVRL